MIRTHIWQVIILVLLLMLPFFTAVVAGPGNGLMLDSNRWFSRETVIDAGVTSIDRVVINGPPEPPAGAFRPAVDPGPGTDAIVTLPVPAFSWCFGCSATSAAMIAAYYDRTSHGDMYTGPTNGGVMPMDNSSWPNWVDSNGDTRAQCPLSATHNGLDGRVIRGHVDDYWKFYNEVGPDPYDGNWTEHVIGDCTGDYMKTNKWFPVQGFNVDGGTTFYNFTDGTRIFDSDLEDYGVHIHDGGYGLKLFYESRGYTVETMFNQYIYGYDGNTEGFTWAEYMAEIDAGRPVMIHVTGHTMVGTGYNTAGQVMYINDTWDYSTHTMTWGGTYGTMTHYGVTIVRVEVATLVELTSFTARGGADRVRIDWETAAELDCAGFHIWRCETKDGNYKRINKELIPARGGGSWGATYQVTDDRVVAGRTYFYKLEDVNLAGHSTLHGPVAARVRAPGGTSLRSHH